MSMDDMSIDELIRGLHTLDRDSCKAALLDIKRPALDFTESYLDQMSTERLRHILMAAYLQARKCGHGDAPAA